ncbi:MAG TPA: hypothetical protein VGK37_04050 [Casimicrobiaceae bacterium]|jgi:hypothetical protein
MSNKHKAKGSARKTVATKHTSTALDRYDPRVKALAQDLLREVFEKEELRAAAERQQEEKAKKEETEKRRAAAEAEATRLLTMDEVLTRMRSLVEPLSAIHDTADHAIAADSYENLAIVALNLSMLCLVRLDACLERQGDTPIGYTEDWVTGAQSHAD